ncbi:MAG TPA: type II toxin-antitoxin system VapC family toxin [Thermoanaerobaculia bacterium]|nr:type II toxin-antitoxin system VapC family toxin [Thermoanaerobaculia bacterium]
MSLDFLLDANVVSEPFRRTPRVNVVRKLYRHRNEVAIASVVWHELRFGLERMPPSLRRDALANYLDSVIESMPILDYDYRAADWHARERARLSKRGLTPPYADGQIAAIASVNDLTLVTFNEADFQRFNGLRVVTWR